MHNVIFKWTKGTRGVMLVEALIAGLLLAITVLAVFAVILSGFSTTKYGEIKYQANLQARQLQEELKNYVTADTSVINGAPGSPAWHLPGDTCSGCAGGANCWALDACTHDVTARLPVEFRNDYNATMSYTVSVQTYSGKLLRDVRIDVNWTAP